MQSKNAPSDWFLFAPALRVRLALHNTAGSNNCLFAVIINNITVRRW